MRPSSRSALAVFAVVALVACGEASGSATSASAAASSAPPPKPSTSASAATTASAAPAPTVKAPPSDVPTAAASANLDMQNATVDGFTLKTVSCKAANANPFTAIGMLSPLAKQQAALDACVDKATDVSLHFAIADKKASDVRVAGAPTPEAAACVAKAIEEAQWNEPLTCVVKLALKSK